MVGWVLTKRNVFFMKKMIRKFKIVSFVLAVGLVLTMSVASADKPVEFTRLDQPFVIFKTDGKYKNVTVADPRRGQCDILVCAAQDPITKETRVIKKPNDFAQLHPLRHIMRNIDWFKKMDKFFSGYRDAVCATLLEESLKVVGLMSDEVYQGSILIDEYNQSFPMRWVLKNAQELKGIRTYFEERVAPAQGKKPLLLVNFLDETSEIDSADLEFLNSYFTLLQDNDPDVVSFFEKGYETIKDIFDKTNAAAFMGEDFGQALIRMLEKDTEEFKFKGLALKATKYVSIAASLGLVYKLCDEFILKEWYKCVTELVKPKETKPKPSE